MVELEFKRCSAYQTHKLGRAQFKSVKTSTNMHQNDLFGQFWLGYSMDLISYPSTMEYVILLLDFLRGLNFTIIHALSSLGNIATTRRLLVQKIYQGLIPHLGKMVSLKLICVQNKRNFKPCLTTRIHSSLFADQGHEMKTSNYYSPKLFNSLPKLLICSYPNNNILEIVYLVQKQQRNQQ